MTNNDETIVEWDVPFTTQDHKRISSNYFRTARRLSILYIVAIAIGFPIVYKVFAVAGGKPPNVSPLIFLCLFFALYPALYFYLALKIRLRKPLFGREHCITQRGLNQQSDDGLSWTNARYFEILKDDDGASPTVCFYRKSGNVIHVRLPYEPTRSAVMEAIEKFVPQYEASKHGPIELNEDPPIFIRIVSFTLAILGGVLTGLTARPLLHSMDELGFSEKLVEYSIIAILIFPIIVWQIIQRVTRPKRERSNAFAWTVASCLTAFVVFGCVAIGPTTIRILRDEISSPTTLPTDVQSPSKKYSGSF